MKTSLLVFGLLTNNQQVREFQQLFIFGLAVNQHFRLTTTFLIDSNLAEIIDYSHDMIGGQFLSHLYTVLGIIGHVFLRCSFQEQKQCLFAKFYCLLCHA